MIAEFHELLPVCEVRAQPAGSTAVNAELALETADEDVMVNGIRGCRKVKANQHSSLLLVSGRVHAVQWQRDNVATWQSNECYMLF